MKAGEKWGRGRKERRAEYLAISHIHPAVDLIPFSLITFLYFMHSILTADMTPEDQVAVLTELRDRVIETALATTGR